MTSHRARALPAPSDAMKADTHLEHALARLAFLKLFSFPIWLHVVNSIRI